MEKRFLAWVGYGFVGIALLAIAVSLLKIAADTVDAHQKGGDLATWAGAVFAALAFGGTIFLARLETQRRHREEQEREQVTAVQVALQVRPLIHALKQAIIAHKNCIKAGSQVSYTKIHKDFSAIPMWTRDDVQSMLRRSGNCATHMWYCATHVEQILMLIHNADNFVSMRELESRNRFYSATLANLEQVLHSAEFVRDDCSEVLKTMPFSDTKFPTPHSEENHG